MSTEPSRPYETLRVEVPTDAMGPVMGLVGHRRGQLEEMDQRGDYSLLSSRSFSRSNWASYKIIERHQGTAIIHRFESYRPVEGEQPKRGNGVLISMVGEKTMLLLYSVFRSEVNYWWLRWRSTRHDRG